MPAPGTSWIEAASLDDLPPGSSPGVLAPGAGLRPVPGRRRGHLPRRPLPAPGGPAGLGPARRVEGDLPPAGLPPVVVRRPDRRQPGRRGGPSGRPIRSGSRAGRSWWPCRALDRPRPPILDRRAAGSSARSTRESMPEETARMANPQATVERPAVPEALTGDVRIFEYSQAADPIASGATPPIPHAEFPASLHEQGPTRVIPLDLGREAQAARPADQPRPLRQLRPARARRDGRDPPQRLVRAVLRPPGAGQDPVRRRRRSPGPRATS